MKDTEITELNKKLLATSPVRIQPEVVNADVFSPTLFSQTESEITDFIGDDEEFLPGQQMPEITSSPFQETPVDREVQDEEVKEEETKIEWETENIDPDKPSCSSSTPQTNQPLLKGWKTKPSRLSFSGMANKTCLFSPGKKKQSTIKECFKNQPPAKVRKETTKATIVQTIQLDTEDEEMEAFRTPVREIKARNKKKSDSLDDFCDECRKVKTIITHRNIHLLTILFPFSTTN